MAGEDDNLVAFVLETDSSVDNQSLSTANAKVWVQKNNGLLLDPVFCHLANEMAHAHTTNLCDAVVEQVNRWRGWVVNQIMEVRDVSSNRPHHPRYCRYLGEYVPQYRSTTVHQ